VREHICPRIFVLFAHPALGWPDHNGGRVFGLSRAIEEHILSEQKAHEDGAMKLAGVLISNWNRIVEFPKQIALLQAAAT
jgi:hypothetical protein